MNNIDRYINKLIRELDISFKEKKELKAQFKDHILNLVNNYIEVGYSEEQAVALAIESFDKSDEFFCDSFTNKNYKMSYVARIFALIMMAVAIFIFGKLFFRINRLYYPISIRDIIPLNYIYVVIDYMLNPNKPDGNIEIITQVRSIFLLIYFISGFLVPIIINKINSCIPTIKICTLFILFFEIIIDNHRNIDFIIFPIIFCVAGYFTMKVLMRKLKNNNFE